MTSTNAFRSFNPISRFRKLTFERLDIRLPMSAESVFTDPAAPEGPDLIEVRLAVSQVDGTLIDDGVFLLREEERFVVDVYVRETETAVAAKDLGREFYGIFQAKIDLQYDPEIVQPVFDEITYGKKFTGQSGGQFDPLGGVIRNLGGYDTSYFGKILVGQSTLSRSEALLASVPFSTLSAGDPAIVPSVGQDTESFLGLGFDTPISPAEVAFRFDPLTILAPTANDNGTDQTVVNTASNLQTIDRGGFDSGVGLRSPLDVGLSSAGPETDSAAVDDSLDRLRLNLNLPALYREVAASPNSILFQRWYRVDLERLLTEGLLGDDGRDDLSLDVIATTGQRTSPPSPLSIPYLSREKKDSESAGLFWRNFDLELLDDEDTTSPMELHFRLFRLQLSEAADPLKQTPERGQQAAETEVPSVLDLGYADISPWLLDAKYHSWTQSQSATREHDISSPARNAKDTEYAIVPWSPQADVTVAVRLELVEETRVDPFAAHAELMRRFGGESLDRVDANTKVPNSHQAPDGLDPPVEDDR